MGIANDMIRYKVWGTLKWHYKKDCQNSKKYLDQGQKVVRPVLLPFINRPIFSKTNKLLGLYSLLCLKDKDQARYFLDQYLAQPDVPPLEKVKVNKEFTDSAL